MQHRNRNGEPHNSLCQYTGLVVKFVSGYFVMASVGRPHETSRDTTWNGVVYDPLAGNSIKSNKDSHLSTSDKCDG